MSWRKELCVAARDLTIHGDGLAAAQMRAAEEFAKASPQARAGDAFALGIAQVQDRNNKFAEIGRALYTAVRLQQAL